MSKKKKLYNKLLSIPKDLRFDELEKALLDYGYVLAHTTGSHSIYTKTGSPTLTLPRKTPVKSYLIEQVLEAVANCLEEKL